MKKIILNSLVILLALSGTTAYAQTSTGVSPETSVNAQMNVKPPKPLLKVQEAIKDRVEARKASSTLQKEMKASSTRDKIGQIARKVFRNRFENMIVRFGATIERQESIMARIISRIEKVKTAGGDVKKSEEFVATAKMHISEAKTTLALLKTNAEMTAELESDPANRTASTTKNSLVNLRKISQDLEKHLRETHKALIGAVTNLLGMSTTRPKPQATTTLQASTTIQVNTQN